MSSVTYESVKTFELQTGMKTRLVVDVSARVQNGKKKYRVGTFRVYSNAEGSEKRSAYLGTREMALKLGLERAAMKFIAEQESDGASSPVSAATL